MVDLTQVNRGDSAFPVGGGATTYPYARPEYPRRNRLIKAATMETAERSPGHKERPRRQKKGQRTSGRNLLIRSSLLEARRHRKAGRGKKDE